MSMSALPVSLTRRCRATVPPAPSRLNTSIVSASPSSSATWAQARAVVSYPLPGEFGTRTRRPLTGPSSVPPPEAAPPSAVVPQPVSSRPAATVPTVSFRREALRMGSSCVSGGRPPLAGTVAIRVARVTLACALGVVVVVCTPPCCGGGPGPGPMACPVPTRQGVSVNRRLSLACQLLALQVVIVCVVLVGVAAVTVAQSMQRSEEVEGRRALEIAETLANSSATRTAVELGRTEYVRITAEESRSTSGSADVVVAGADRTVLASADPELLGRPLDLGASRVLEGRSWVGDVELPGGGAAVAMAPVYSARGDRVLGLVAVQRRYPGVLGSLEAAAPNLLTYLGLASALGIGGSLLLARRVKRQTLGLEPAEIAGLVEHRDAMLHGIREGVVGLDLRGRVTLVNDEAIRLLRIPGDALGRTLEELGVAEEVRAALLSTGVERDRAVGSAGRVLVVNRLRSEERRVGKECRYRWSPYH